MPDRFEHPHRPRPRVRRTSSVPTDLVHLREKWPPPDRENVDIALVAVRILAVSGRLRAALKRAARSSEVQTDLVPLLMLFSESNRRLRIGDIAQQLGVSKATASRLATRAEAVGLIDKTITFIDGREVACRISVAGRLAITRCLDALRPHAVAALRPVDDSWITAALELLEPSTRLERATRNSGWRAGIRAGMPAGE